MKSNSTGFWLTVALVLAVAIIGTIDAVIRRIGGFLSRTIAKHKAA